MLWYSGSIPEAIAESKSKKKIFLVFLAGDDEFSQKMLETYDQPEVLEKLTSSCLAIKLAANSEQFRQFSQIYPVEVVPSSFFIGGTGLPLEIVAGPLGKEDFLMKIKGAIEKHENSQKPSAPKMEEPPRAPQVEVSPQLSSPVSSPTPEDSAKDIQEEPISEPSSSNATQEIATSENSQSTPSLEEKVARAKQLMELNKQLKMKEEQEKEKEAELERRRAAKEMALAQEAKLQREYEELARERAREREEARLARERVLQQIAQDKAERQAASQHQQDQVEAKRRKLQEEAAAEERRRAEEAAQRSDVARIQFRLPAGDRVNHQFLADDTLQTLHDYIKNEVQPGFSSFTLAVAYPRHQFTTEQLSATLRELLLVPTATLLVLPTPSVANQAVSATSSGLFSIIWFVMLPFTNLWHHISGWLFGHPRQSSGSPGLSPSPAAAYRQRPPSHNSASPSSAPASSSPELRNRRAQSSTTFQRQGNVFRLSNNNPEEDDDDNNTWNGNSTQQM